MKINIFIGSLDIGGAEHQAYLFAAYLAKKNYQIELVTIFPGGKYWDLAQAQGLKLNALYPAPLSKIKKTIALLSLPFTLMKKVKGDEPTIIYSYLDYCNLHTAILKIFKPQTKIIWGIRRSFVGNLLSAEWKLYLIEKLCGLFSKKTNAIVYNSQVAVDYYQQHFGFTKKNNYVIYNAVDTQRFTKNINALSQRQQFDLAATATVIGVFGRIAPYKGHAVFIKAFSLLHQAYPQTQALILGPADAVLLAQLKAEVKSLGLEQAIVFALPTEKMPDRYNLLDVLCSPSLSEGTSNVILEAMASELPVVVTDVGDSNYLVGPENIVVPSKQEEALYLGLEKMLLQKNNWLQIGAQNRLRMQKEFSAEKNFAALEKIMLEISS